MTAVLLSPLWNGTQFFDANGDILAGGFIYTYEAGSFSTQLATYTTISGSIANSNPIVLDSSGRITTEIWLISGDAYNLVLTDSTNTVITSVDQVVGTQPIPTTTPGSTSVWELASTPTYISSTIFEVAGNQVSSFAVGNRVELTVGSGFIYGTVSAVTFASGFTQVTIIPDTVSIDSSLSAVSYSVLSTIGPVVDAGAITYESGLTYSIPGTVGYQIANINTTSASIQSELNNELLVQTTTGSGTAYVLTPLYASASYTVNQEWKVRFHTSSTGACTFQVDGLSAIGLYQYTTTGTLVNAIVIGGMVSDVFFDGSNMILVDSLPSAVAIWGLTDAVGPEYYEISTVVLLGTGTVTKIRNFGRKTITVSGSGAGTITVTLPMAIPNQVLRASVTWGTVTAGGGCSIFNNLPTLPAGATTAVISFYITTPATYSFDYLVEGY